MGRPSHDVDMCCSGLWQESKAALESADIAVVESGIKFGGITAICDGERIEVTTYRLDGFYTDGRHPQSVERAASLEDDLARRDFTVNAMVGIPIVVLSTATMAKATLSVNLSVPSEIPSVALTRTRFACCARCVLPAVWIL